MRALLLLSALAVVWGDATEVRETEVERGTLSVCPPQAVCADIFDYHKTDPDTGERVPSRRRIINCICPNRRRNDSCPNHKRNTLHASIKHRQQICERKNTLDRCSSESVAEEMHVNADEFDGKTFYRMLCRCVRHRNPLPNGGGLSERATYLLRNEFVEDHWVHMYGCLRNQRDREERRRRRNRQT